MMKPPPHGGYRPDRDESPPEPVYYAMVAAKRGLDRLVQAGRALCRAGKARQRASGGGGGPPNEPNGPGGAGGSGTGGAASKRFGRFATRNDLNKFKKEMLAAIREMKLAAEAQHKAQARFAASLLEENRKLKDMVERLASDLKSAMEAEARSGKLTQEKLEEFTRLINELSKTVRKLKLEKSPESNSLLSAIENMLKTQSRCRTLYIQLQDFTTIVGAIVALIGFLNPKSSYGPGFYENIGKEARNVIFEDYFCGCQLNVVPGFVDDVFLSMGRSVLNGVSTTDVFAKFRRDNVSARMTCSLEGNVTSSVSVKEVYGPGVKFKLHMGFPLDGKVELQSRHAFAGIRGSIGLAGNPLCYLSVLLGTKKKSFGGCIEFDTAQGVFRKFSIGGSYKYDNDLWALTFDHLSEITVALHRQRWDNTSLASQLVHSLRTRQTRFIVGLEHILDPSLVLKGRVSDNGLVGAMARIQVTSKAALSLSAEVNLRAVRQAPRLGISFVFNGNAV